MGFSYRHRSNGAAREKQRNDMHQRVASELLDRVAAKAQQEDGRVLGGSSAFPDSNYPLRVVQIGNFLKGY